MAAKGTATRKRRNAPTSDPIVQLGNIRRFKDIYLYHEITKGFVYYKAIL